jgi:hypothetical protein
MTGKVSLFDCELSYRSMPHAVQHQEYRVHVSIMLAWHAWPKARGFSSLGAGGARLAWHSLLTQCVACMGTVIGPTPGLHCSLEGPFMFALASSYPM